MKRCPKCGCTTFFASAHVTQDWKLDGYGDFIEVIDDCTETTHFPDDNDEWVCAECGYDAAGADFNDTSSFLDIVEGDIVAACDTDSHDYVEHRVKVLGIEHNAENVTDTNPTGLTWYGEDVDGADDGDAINVVTEANFISIIRSCVK